MTRNHRRAFFLGFSCAIAALAGCSDPIERAFDDCMERIEAGIAEAEHRMPEQNAVTMRPIVRRAAEAGCRAMRDARCVSCRSG